MCLTTEALVLFLNIVGHDIVTSDPGVFTVHSEVGPVEYVAVEDLWCTNAPQEQHAARMASAQ